MKTVQREETTSTGYQRYTRRKALFLLGLLLTAIFMALLSLSVGSSGMPLKDVVRTLLGRSGDASMKTILFQVRMPRVLTAVAVGMALALAGCVMQSVLRNPLASASTLGVSQGASFGAAVAIVYFHAGSKASGNALSSITFTNPYIIVILAFLGGMTTTVLILFLSKVRGVSPTVMILVGVALSAMFSGATTLIQYFSDDEMVASIVYWTFGSLGRAGSEEIALIFITSFLSFLYFFYNRWNYNAMESGVQTAKSLGVPVDRLILVSMFLATLISATAIAFVGTISFIGLIAPHMVRKVVGSDYRFLLPGSALLGSMLMLFADLLSRTVRTPAVLPIGAVTSFLGAPLFLYLILKKGKRR